MADLQNGRNKRNSTLELFKLLCACLVVVGHIGLPGVITTYYSAAARFAIPFFFMTSGYFLYQAPPEKILRGLRKMLVAYGIAVLLYNLNTIWDLLVYGGFAAIPMYYAQHCNLTTLLVYLLFNVSPSFEPLWFLLSMIYVQTIYYLVRRHHISEKKWFVGTIVGFLLMQLLSEGLLLLGVSIPVFFYRNFLIMGCPLMGLGMLIRKHSERLSALPGRLLLLVMALGFAEELLFVGCVGKAEFYLGSHVIAVSLFILCLQHPNLQIAEKLSPVTSLSLFVYLSHMLIYSLIKRVALQTSVDINGGPYKISASLSVCLIAIGLGWLLERVKSVRKEKQKRTISV